MRPAHHRRAPSESCAGARPAHTDDEIQRITRALGFDDVAVATKSQVVSVAFLFAIETAMRAGETCELTKGDIIGRTVVLHDTKNGTRRHVPLLNRALELLGLLPARDSVFGISTSSLDALFRKAKETTGIENLTFHDTRHETNTRLARMLNVLDLARMVGHRNLRMLGLLQRISRGHRSPT